MKNDPMRIEDSLTREYVDRAAKMRALEDRGELRDPVVARWLMVLDVMGWVLAGLILVALAVWMVG